MMWYKRLSSRRKVKLLVFGVYLSLTFALTGCWEQSPQSPQRAQPETPSAWATSKFISVKQALDKVLTADGYAPFGSPIEDHTMIVYFQDELGLALGRDKRDHSIVLEWSVIYTLHNKTAQAYAIGSFWVAWRVFSQDQKALTEPLIACMETGKSTTIVLEDFTATLSCSFRPGRVKITFRRR